MTDFIDRDELLSRMVALRHANSESGVQRIALCNAFIAILEAMPVPSCETCIHFPHYHICKKDHRPVRWDTFSCSDWEAKP